MKPTDYAFTDSVKQVQEERGSRHGYAEMVMGNQIDSNLATFIETRVSFYMATASAEGQPYIQHRGGPAGFLKVIDSSTLGFADFKGNRQYITTGNLRENNKAYLFLMDYMQRQRVKIWGEARVIEDDPGLIQSLMPAGYKARASQAILFDIKAWDVNCPQHIPQMFEADDVAAVLAKRDARIEELEKELAALES